jgi:hypothetical protein
MNALCGIMEGERGVSEKDFARQEELGSECDEIVRAPGVDAVIRRFECQGCRPQFCAECVFDGLS